MDTQVKIRGYRIELAEIESVLMKVPGVAVAVVTTWESAPGLVELVAFYTSVDSMDHERLFSQLRSHLPAYMMPSFVERLPLLPMLPSDKVDRKRLPPPKGPRCFNQGHSYSAPKDRNETILAQALSDLLGAKQVSVEDHFFDDLGSNSLTMARFCAILRDRSSFPTVSMREIYLNPTIRKLSQALGSAVTETAPAWANCVRLASNSEFITTGVLQLLLYFAGTFALGVAVVEGFAWVHLSESLIDAYLRAIAFGGGLFVFLAALPMVLKWLLVGRWKRETIPIWSLRYVKFWIVRSLLAGSPMVVFAGSPIYSVYLRLLGAKIGRNAVIFTRIPVCTDLISIGSNSVVRKDSLLTGYWANGGTLEIGPIAIGTDAFVGEGTVLDIDSSVGDGAQLGHSSSLQKGQSVSCGKKAQGSPAQPTNTDFIGIASTRPSTLRKAGYTAFQLAALFTVAIPFVVLLVEFIVRWLLFDRNPHASGFEDFHIGPPSLHLDLLLFSAALYIAFLSINIGLIYLIPRTFGRLLRADRTYPLYGLHYIIYQIVSAGSNSRALNHLFGDSSFIIHFLKVVGYRMPGLIQTGANFGLEQKHDLPQLCEIGSGTIVSDGLSMINAQVSSTSFKLSKARIGAQNYLGNNIFYVAGGRTGENVLLATKVAVPLDEHVRSNTGLLGSPCFEIPRTVLRDRQFDHLKTGPEFERRLFRKAISNAAGILLFVITRWLYAYILLVAIGAVITYFTPFGYLLIPAFALTVPTVTIAYFMLVERASLSFNRLQPKLCSMYDEYYWRHERYWKLNASPFVGVFAGTPLMGWIWRLLGVRVGRKLFDDGCTMPERSLVEIGDYCTLNRQSILQGHSQEDGTFKSDRIRVGNGATIGCNAFVHYGTAIGDNACVGADSFLMKGEVMPSNSLWLGNPAKQIRG